MLLPAARQHRSQGHRGRQAARYADPGRGNRAGPRPLPAFAAAPGGVDRAGGGKSAAARGRRRLRMVLPRLLDASPSGGSQRPEYRAGSAAAVRGLLRREAPMSAMRARSSGKGVKPADRTQAAARRLLEAHERRERYRPLPKELAPRTEEEAYAIQDGFVALRATKLGGIAGYKIALATAEMQRFVGVNAPQAGAMLEFTLHRAPARVRAADYVHLIVEFEIAVELAEDLPVADAPFFRSRVAQAVGGVMPAIELADDGKAVGEGKGAQAMGHPFDAVAWMADHLARHGRALLRGDVVITGSLITSKEAKQGDLVKFALEGLGEAELRVD